MSSPLQAFIQLGLVPPVSFPTDSRYYNSAVLSYTTSTGQMITYLARRFVPQPGTPNYSTVATHTVTQADRLDLIAAKYLGDPLIYWLICDANGAMRPGDLLQPGTVINITLPQGVPGGKSA